VVPFDIRLPAFIPAIVLPECNLFPHALLPLNIFEPRYRAMLREALAKDRLFCVATLKQPGAGGWHEGDENIHGFSCAGLVRAAVRRRDGTSRLILQGLQRIRFLEWSQREPFRLARMEPLPSLVRCADKADRLARQAMERARESVGSEPTLSRQFDRQFGELRDPEIIADVLGYNFLATASDRQPLLAMEIVEDRLAYVLHRLNSLPAPG
jgi:ATP-dependent Lon protease